MTDQPSKIPPSGLKEGAELYTQIREKSLYTLLERTLAPVLNFLVSVMIIRLLPVEDYGIYKILLAILGYITLTSSLGLPSVFHRFIPEFYQKGEFGKLKNLVQRGLAWRLVLCIGLVALMLIFSQQLGRLFQIQDSLRYLAIFSIGIIFYLQSTLLTVATISVLQHKRYLVMQLTYFSFRAGLIISLLLSGQGLMGVVIGETAAYLVLYVLYTAFFLGFMKRNPGNGGEKLPVRRLVRFGGFSYLNEAGAKILSISTDYFVISAFMGPAAVGIYAFAAQVMTLISRFLPHNIFQNVIRPFFFGRYHSENNAHQLEDVLGFLIKMISFVSIPLLAGVLILGDKLIIYVFDPKYLPSLKILWVVTAFMALNFYLDPVALVLQAKEKVQILFYSKIFAIYNLILDLLLIRPYGIMGVALATGSAVLFKNLFCYYHARKLVKLRLDLKSLFRIIVNTAIMSGPVYLLKDHIHNLGGFIAVTALGAGIYLLASFFLKAFSEKERKIINKILPRPFFVF